MNYGGKERFGYEIVRSFAQAKKQENTVWHLTKRVQATERGAPTRTNDSE